MCTSPPRWGESPGKGENKEHLNFEAELNAPDTVHTAVQLALYLRAARDNDGWDKQHDYYEGDLSRMLCTLAGMGDAYSAARSVDEQAQVTDAAAKALGVTI